MKIVIDSPTQPNGSWMISFPLPQGMSQETVEQLVRAELECSKQLKVTFAGKDVTVLFEEQAGWQIMNLGSLIQKIATPHRVVVTTD